VSEDAYLCLHAGVVHHILYYRCCWSTCAETTQEDGWMNGCSLEAHRHPPIHTCIHPSIHAFIRFEVRTFCWEGCTPSRSTDSGWSDGDWGWCPCPPFQPVSRLGADHYHHLLLSLLPHLTAVAATYHHAQLCSRWTCICSSYLPTIKNTSLTDKASYCTAFS